MNLTDVLVLVVAAIITMVVLSAAGWRSRR